MLLQLAKDVAKENPITSTISLITFASLIIGTFLTIDARYAHAAEITQLQRQLIINDTKSEIRSLKSRKLQLEDKVIDSTVKQQSTKTPITDAEKVINERYKIELIEINDEIKQKNNTLRDLEVGR